MLLDKLARDAIGLFSDVEQGCSDKPLGFEIIEQIFACNATLCNDARELGAKFGVIGQNVLMISSVSPGESA